jgi:hypothetical protein
MKRLFVALLAMAAVTLALAAAAGADAIGDSSGPACSDIVFGQPGYVVENEPANTAFATVGYRAAPCPDVAYTFVVIYKSGGRWTVKYQSFLGRDADPASSPCTHPDTLVTYTCLDFLIPDVVADPGASGRPEICVLTLTSKKTLGRGFGRIYDTAPDRGCITVVADESPGGGHPAW